LPDPGVDLCSQSTLCRSREYAAPQRRDPPDLCTRRRVDGFLWAGTSCVIVTVSFLAGQLPRAIGDHACCAGHGRRPIPGGRCG
jgi:hypothetical protein